MSSPMISHNVIIEKLINKYILLSIYVDYDNLTWTSECKNFH